MLNVNKSDLLAALTAYNPNNYIPVEKIVIPHFEVPEKAYYRKELVHALTKDAKFLLRLVLDTPDEFLSLLFKDNGEVRTTVLSDMLKHRGWRPKKIEQIRKEVKTFIRNYYGG